MSKPSKPAHASVCSLPTNIPLHVKTRGAIAEHLFTAHALALGFMVSKPVLENSRYDLILDLCDLPSTHPPCRFSRNSKPATRNFPRMLRVQVKSAWTLTYDKRWVSPERALSRASKGRGQRQQRVAAPLEMKQRGRYQIATGCGPHFKRRYTTANIDFLAAYLAPLSIASGGAGLKPCIRRSSGVPSGRDSRLLGWSSDDPITRSSEFVCGTWYIIPAHEITHCLSLYFSPNPTTSRLMKYRERWDLLLG